MSSLTVKPSLVHLDNTKSSESEGTMDGGRSASLILSSSQDKNNKNQDAVTIAFIILAIALAILVLGSIFWGVGAGAGIASLAYVGKVFFSVSLALIVGSVFRICFSD